MEDNSQHTLIEFSQQLLEKMIIKDAIFHLQHGSGFNINLILYLLWVATTRRGHLSKRQIKQAQSHIIAWHQRVIAELKYTHALVATHPDPIAISLKQLLEEEIAKAFVIEQHMLQDVRIKNGLLQRNQQQQLADACASIAHYCELRNELLVEQDRDAFTQLLSAVFTDVTCDVMQRQVSAIFNRFDEITLQPIQQMLW